MANIVVSTSQNDVAVTNIYSNIVVSESNSNITVASVANAVTNVVVSATTTEVNVTQTATVSNQSVRAAIDVANISGYGNLTYDNNIDTSNGIIQYTGVSSADIHSEFSSENLSGFGTVNYVQANGAIQYTGISTSQIRGLFSAINTPPSVGGLGYDSGTGTFVYQLVPVDIYQVFSNTSPITFDGATGVIGWDGNTDDVPEGTTNLYFSGKTTSDLTEGSNLYYTNARVLSYILDNGLDYNAEKVINGIESGNVTLKQFQETYYDAGNASGAVNLDLSNGTIQRIRLIGNISGISVANLSVGGSITVIATQDDTGNKSLTDAVNWSEFKWAGELTQVDPTADAESIITIFRDDTNYNASLVRFDAYDVFSGKTTDDLPEGSTNLYYSNTRVNAFIQDNITTSDIDEGTNLYFTDARANSAITTHFGDNDNSPFVFNGDIEVQGNIDYVNVQDLQVVDNEIILNFGNATARDAFVIVDRSGSALSNAYLKWNETADQWEVYDGTNTIVIGAQTVESVNGQTGVVVLDTDDIAEGSANLYYTDARVDAHLNIATANATQVLSWTGTDYDWVDASTGNVDSVNGQTGVVVLDTDDISEGNTNLYYTDGRFDTRLASKTTTDLSEGTNLYYTDARANSAIDARVTSLTANVDSVNGATGVVVLDTDDVAEGATNLYYSNARVNAFIQDSITTTDIDEGDNLYYTDARANSAIDARVDKAYVDALGVDYNTLANTPTLANVATSGDYADLINTPANVSDFTNDAGYLVAANLTSLTANVNSVNGATGIVVLDTDDISEGAANLYYSNARVNAFIQDNITTSDIDEGNNLYYTDTRSRSAISATGNITYDANTGVIGESLTTTDIDEGDNLYYTDARANSAIDAYVSGSENIDVNSGVITLANTLGNVNQITTESGSGFTITSRDGVTAQQQFAGVDVDVLSINGDAYAVFKGLQWFSAPRASYSGTANLTYFIWQGNVTSGDANIAVQNIGDGSDASAANLAPNVSVLSPGYIIDVKQSGQTQYFSPDAYVIAVDGANNIVTMSEPALATGFASFAEGYFFSPAAVDTTTGQVVQITSELEASNFTTGSYTTIQFTDPVNRKYGYPQTGYSNTDFDIYAVGTSTDYEFDDVSDYTVARTSITPANTVLKAPLGITIGENTELTSRGENDNLTNFGLNILWDGLNAVPNRQIGDIPYRPQTSLLIKQYTDNSQQQVAGGAAGPTGAGPRLFFTSAFGNASVDASQTYPRVNQELGRISWWGTSGQQTAPSTYNVPAFISVSAADDWETHAGGSSVAGNTNVYMGGTSTGVNPDTYLAYKDGELYLGGGGGKPVTFAPAYNGSATRPNDAYVGIITKWAEINYADVANTTGSKFAVTNGGSVGAGTVGDMEFVINRNDNTSTTNTLIQTIFSGSLVTAVPFWAGAIILALPPAVSSTLNGQIATISATGTITESATGNESALGGNQYILNYAFDGATYQAYLLTPVGGGALVTYTSIGGTDPIALVPPVSNAIIDQTNSPTVTTQISSGVTAKEYKFRLAEQSNDLVLLQDDAVHTTFDSAGNITATAFIGDVTGNVTGNLTGDVTGDLTGNVTGTTVALSGIANITGNINLGPNSAINYDAVYGCFHNLSNITAATADTVFEFEWPSAHINNKRVTVESNSEITVGQSGTYKFDLEMQAENSGNQERTAFLWLAKNGTDIAETCVRVNLLKEASQVITKVWLVEELNADDYVEVRFAVDNVTNIQLTTIPAQTSPYARPAVPSAVITVTQVESGITPDYDGGNASTSIFQYSVDGGDASTTQFEQITDGGDA